MAGAGVSGPAVAMAAGGALMIYAGLTNQHPLDALRGMARGKLQPVMSPGSTVPGSVSSAINQSANAAEFGGGLPGAGRPIGELLAGAALKYVGRPYKLGGNGNPAFDCSSLVQRAFLDIGIADCPRTTEGQFVWRMLERRPKGYVPTVGDLVFWPGHVVISLGSGQVVGAQNPRRGVVRTDLKSAGVPGTGITGILYYHDGTG